MLNKLFIEAGWHTVPLEGTLERLANGDKTVPGFECDWRKKYTKKFNTLPVPLAGAITGKVSNIIAIDCDNQTTYDLFKSLDPHYTFHFISKGKPEGGGTIIYKYTDAIGTFKLTNEFVKLDFYADEGFVYLPTENNHTKESWENKVALPEIKEAPATVLAVLKTFKAKILDKEPTKSESKAVISNRLAPLVEILVKNEKYEPNLFKVLTPKSFRDIPSYISKGHLHPNDVPEGRGSEYMSKISAILGADISISVELYTKAMFLINSFWKNPIEKSKFLSTIINPMVEERASVDGQVIWQYDPDWEKMGFIATAINGDYIESFYDDIKGSYYLINYSVPYVRVFGEKRGIINTLKTLLGRAITEIQYDSTKQIIRTLLNPSLEFGHVEGTDKYNLFRQTKELSIVNNPGPYKQYYKRPNTLLKYFQTFIPDDEMRNFTFRFLKTKFSTFSYSPIIFYFIGAPGSGKDTFLQIMGKILGEDYIAKPDTKVFLEQYNGWIIDKYFIQLDEYGNKLNRHTDKQECLGKLKAYTGSETMQIRAMRTDGYNYKHCITFMLTANLNPLPVELDDRRFAFVKTPNILKDQDWVSQQGGVSLVHSRILSEVTDFCYFLATEVKNLSGDDYVIPPMTKDKEKLILDNLPAAEQITYYIKNSKFDRLLDLAIEYGIYNFDLNWENNKLEDDKLLLLYEKMTDGAGHNRTILKALKNAGFNRSHTTKNGENHFYFYLPLLHKFKSAETSEEDFIAHELKTQKANDLNVKGL